MTETFNFLFIDSSFNISTHQMGALRKFLGNQRMYEIIAMTHRRGTYFGSFDQAVVLFPHLCVPLELSCLPTTKASLSKDWEYDWQDSVSSYSQRMLFDFILSLHLSFWCLARSVI